MCSSTTSSSPSPFSFSAVLCCRPIFVLGAYATSLSIVTVMYMLLLYYICLFLNQLLIVSIWHIHLMFSSLTLSLSVFPGIRLNTFISDVYKYLWVLLVTGLFSVKYWSKHFKYFKVLVWLFFYIFCLSFLCTCYTRWCHLVNLRLAHLSLLVLLFCFLCFYRLICEKHLVTETNEWSLVKTLKTVLTISRKKHR